MEAPLFQPIGTVILHLMKMLFCVATILACTRYAAANLERLVELDMNPVIVRPVGRGAVAVDALIRLVEEP